MEAGAVLIDGRDQREFDAAHVPGSINVTMNQSGVGTAPLRVVDPESEIIVAAEGDEGPQMARMLEAVGFTQHPRLPCRWPERLACCQTRSRNDARHRRAHSC